MVGRGIVIGEENEKLRCRGKNLKGEKGEFGGTLKSHLLVYKCFGSPAAAMYAGGKNWISKVCFLGGMVIEMHNIYPFARIPGSA